MPAKELRFDTYEDWETFLNEYMQNSKHHYVKGKNCKRLKSGPKKTANCNKDLEYYLLNYECKFGMPRESESEGHRNTL